MTFIIAVGQDELLTKSGIDEVPECHVTRITDTVKCGCTVQMMHSRKANPP